eukprot:8477331-Karenia_brevis.AAC.1
MKFSVLLPQGEIEEELSELNCWQEDLRRMIDNGDLPKGYEEHPVVKNNPGEPVLPLGLFVDAVPYSQVDELEGF